LDSDCHFFRKQSLLLASRQRDIAGLDRECRIRRRHGFGVTMWSRQKIATNSTLPHSGALLSHDAAVVDAYALTHALIKDACVRGLRVHERTVVKRVETRRSGVAVHCNRHAVVRARKVVIAAGYEAQNFLSRQWGSLHSTYAIATLPMDEFPGWPDDLLLWETARPYVYARRTEDGRAIIGGYDEPFRDPRSRDALLPAKSAALLRRLRALFPEIQAETAYAWSGTFAETPDSLPYVGVSPDNPRAYVALGYGGNGIIFSMLAAGIIRDLHLGEPNPAIALFGFDR
jgi:glycine/D-amino acid oxidase-like deaminating enzyme